MKILKPSQNTSSPHKSIEDFSLILVNIRAVRIRR